MNPKDTTQGRSEDIDEIWSLFAIEGGEALDLVEECLLELETNPGDTKRVPELFRAMHTFKGMAGMMGLATIESLGHRAEDLIGQVRDHGVTPTSEMITLLLATLDQARAMLTYASIHRQDADPALSEELLAQLSAMVNKNNAPSGPQPAEPPPAPAEAAPTPQPVEPVEPPPAPPVVQPAPPAPEVNQVAQVDPATDPLYVEIFLELAQEQISRINAASNALFEGNDAALSNLEAALDTLKYAAEQMHYERLLDTLDRLSDAAGETDREQRDVRLKEIELSLFEELTVIQESVSPGATATRGGISFAWLFRQWHADRVFADLAHLGEVADDLERLLSAPVLDAAALAQERHLADEATYLLQAIYHSCLFYKLDLASYLTLALEDLFARIAQAEMTANKPLAELTKNLVRQLGETVDSIREGDTPEAVDWDSMIQQTEAILYIHTEGQASQVTKDMLDLLELPQEFKEIITPENLLEIAQALHAGLNFYIILADINQNEAVGLAFFEWSQSADIRLITNITVLQGSNSLFKFLLTTGRSAAEIAAALSEIDPTGQHLLWEACALREEFDLQQVASPRPRQESRRRAKVKQEQAPVIEQDTLADFIGLIGKLLAAHGVLRKVTERVAQSDLLENMSRWQRQFGSNNNGAWQDFEAAVEAMAESAHTLSQVETEIGVGLDQLYETALAMRTKSMADIFDELQDSIAALAQHHGKQVAVDVTGAEIDMDHTTLDLLDDPLHGLMRFVMLYSLEPPAQRQAAGKSPRGRMMVRASKRDNRLHIVIEDDGRGLDEVVVLHRARELGWTQADNVSPEMLAEWALTEGFGAVYNDGESDLWAIKAALQRRQGQLTLALRPEGGLRFELTLPLNMSVLNGMVVRAGRVQYVVPIDVIHRIVKPARSEIIQSSADGGGSLLRLGQEIIPIHHLNGATNGNDALESLMVVVERDEQPIALTVEELIGEQQVLIQPLQGYIAEVRGVSGCALLGDGEVGMILDLNQIELS